MTRAQEAAIAAMESAFGRLIRDASVGDKWITWRSPHKAAALSARTAAALAGGAQGVFVRAEARGTVVGCLNPD